MKSLVRLSLIPETCDQITSFRSQYLTPLFISCSRGIPDYAILLCFLSGCVTIVFGILRLGFLVEFVSIPVVSGFTSAASLIIACSQIKSLLGIKIHGESFVEIWLELANNIHRTRIPDLILSCCCILILLTLKVIHHERYRSAKLVLMRREYVRIRKKGKKKDRKLSEKKETTYVIFFFFCIFLLFQKLKDIKVSNGILRKLIWFVGTGRNALVVILCAVASYVFENHGEVPFALTGNIDAGLPTIAPPSFSITVGNRTETFVEICKNLGSGIVIVPLISIIGNVAIAKAFCKFSNGYLIS